MKRENRVLKNSEILYIIKKGKIFKTSHLNTYTLNNQSNGYKITVCIAKKVAKLAVTRNRIKRRINSILMQNFDKKNMYDIIIVCKLGVEKLTFQELNNQIDVFLKHLSSKKGGNSERK